MPDVLLQLLASPVWIYISHVLTWLAVGAVFVVFRARISKFLDVFSDRSGSAINDKSNDRALGIAAAAACFALLLLFEANLFFAIFVSIPIFIGTPVILRKRRFAKFQKAFDGSLVESLATVASSLRAGLTLKDSLVVSVQNCPPVFAAEVSRVLKDYRFGKSLDASLDGVRRRVRTNNANIAFGTLIIGTQLGGKIPEVLSRIVQTIRETDRVEGRLKALTAQGRAQGVLLCSMPIVITIGLYIVDREKIEMMFASSLGQVLIGIAVFLEIVGIAVTAKMMKLDI
jgi:tight adherence protein B